jgi:hypothetical protein
VLRSIVPPGVLCRRIDGSSLLLSYKLVRDCRSRAERVVRGRSDVVRLRVALSTGPHSAGPLDCRDSTPDNTQALVPHFARGARVKRAAADRVSYGPGAPPPHPSPHPQIYPVFAYEPLELNG